MPTADDFRAELRSLLRGAELRGARHVDVNAGTLHRKLGGYPGPRHHMPTCCNVMYEEQRGEDQCLARPPKGKGASLTIRYLLPRRR